MLTSDFVKDIYKLTGAKENLDLTLALVDLYEKTKKRHRSNNHTWTKEEEIYIRENRGKQTMKAIAAYLGVTHRMVTNKCYQIDKENKC